MGFEFFELTASAVISFNIYIYIENQKQKTSTIDPKRL